MLEQYGNFNAYQRAQYNSHMMSQSNLKGQIQAWDLDGDGHISKGEAQAGMEKFAYMSSLMNKSEAQEFWQTFENNPDAAMDALNMKYGVQAESMKAFQETANARGLTDTQLGQIIANEDIYKAEYNEGKNMLIQNLARELGTGEAALKASDGKFYAVGMFAENLYEQTRDGKITQDEAAKQLTEYMGAARAVAAASKDTLDTGALAAGSFLKETEVGGKESYEKTKELYKDWDPESSDTGTPETKATLEDLKGVGRNFTDAPQSTPVAPERVETPQRVDVAQVTSQTQAEAPRTDVQAHGDPENSDTGAPESNKTIQD
ncbi:MAG: hypothetical protein LRY51_13455 [Geovibrio sp.]|nr:hypothetical protein [Geovibrio sp.]